MAKPSSACVLLFHPETALVLVEVHEHGFGLPGGKCEPSDHDTLDTARRELREETGVELRSASSIFTYNAGPHVCESFLAVEHGPVPELLVGKGIAWVTTSTLIDQRLARFPTYCGWMFAQLASRSRRPWEVVRCR